jgi:glycosyltransferase involved in cell wall biosynthesis
MQLLSLIRHLDRRVVEPHLCLLDGENEVSRALEPTDCPVLRLGIRSFRSATALGQAWRFFRFLRRERIDVLQVYFFDSATFGAVVGRLAGVRQILRVRNNIGHWANQKNLKRFRWVNRLISAILTNSDAGRKAAIAQERVPSQMVLLLENSIDFDRFPASPNVGRFGCSNPKRVGIVANFRKVKGLDVFLDAAARIRAADADVQFLIAGDHDGEDTRPELDRQVESLGLSEHVKFLGRVADVPSFLDGLDVAVLSSRAEGTSNALIEYMAAGLPIVASAVGGNLALIRDGIDGILVPPDDPDRLASAVTRLLRNPAEAAGLAGAAYSSIRERFGSGGPAKTYERLYLNLRLANGHGANIPKPELGHRHA